MRNYMFKKLAKQGINIGEFLLPYEQILQNTGKRNIYLMNNEEANIEHFESVLENVGTGLPLFIGGCAAGSKIATRVASSNLGIYAGLINVGY